MSSWWNQIDESGPRDLAGCEVFEVDIPWDKKGGLSCDEHGRLKRVVAVEHGPNRMIAVCPECGRWSRMVTNNGSRSVWYVPKRAIVR